MAWTHSKVHEDFMAGKELLPHNFSHPEREELRELMRQDIRLSLFNIAAAKVGNIERFRNERMARRAVIRSIKPLPCDQLSLLERATQSLYKSPYPDEEVVHCEKWSIYVNSEFHEYKMHFYQSLNDSYRCQIYPQRTLDYLPDLVYNRGM